MGLVWTQEARRYAKVGLEYFLMFFVFKIQCFIINTYMFVLVLFQARSTATDPLRASTAIAITASASMDTDLRVTESATK